MKSNIEKTHAFIDSLRSDGWFTPDTYMNHSEPFPNTPGVYLFNRVYVTRGDHSFGAHKVLYVGKSINLRKRQKNHETYQLIRREIECTDSIQRWFKPLDRSQIDNEEIRLIKRFHPTYNLIHRVRGV